MALTESQLEQMVDELTAIDSRSSWDRVLQAGKVILHGVAGDVHGWRTQATQRAVSLRQLARHPGCPFKRTGLSSAVNVYIFARENQAVLKMKAIKPTHVAHVIRLGNPKALELLAQASVHGWSVRELKRHVRAMSRRRGERRGRPLSSASSKAETRARRAVNEMRATLDLLLDCAPSDEASRLNLIQNLRQVSELAIQSRQHLERMSKTPVTSIALYRAASGDC